MNIPIHLEEVLASAFKLTPKDRLQPIEHINASLENEIEAVSQAKTGAEIVAMLQTIDPIEFVTADIEDPVEWVKAQRRKREKQLQPSRDEE